MADKMKTMDGNTAAAYAAYALSEVAAIYENSSDDSFKGSGRAGTGKLPRGTHPLSDKKKLIQAHLVSDARAGTSGNYHTFDLGELTYEILGETQIQFITNDHTENGIAEKLQTFIAVNPIIGNRSMS